MSADTAARSTLTPEAIALCEAFDHWWETTPPSLRPDSLEHPRIGRWASRDETHVLSAFRWHLMRTGSRRVWEDVKCARAVVTHYCR